MRRSSGLLVLVVCLALLAATLATTVGSIALGAWTPLGERPAPTTGPGQLPGPGDGDVTYADFLDDVRSGSVVHVNQSGPELNVSTQDGGYLVVLESPDLDVVGDITGAAVDGGVSPPSYSVDGQMEDLGERTYAEMLEDVAAGRLQDVSQSGATLSCSGFGGYYVVALDDPGHDVLGDIEAAAAEAGIPPPPYSKYPEG